MNAENPLANLRDIHLPEQISWWPLAPGWWLVILLVITLFVWLGYKLWQRHQFRETYRLCQAEIVDIATTYETKQDPRQLLADYSQLLRRLLIMRLGRQGVANQHGDNLLALLESQGLSETLSDEFKVLLLEGPYQKRIDIPDYQQLKASLDSTLLNLSLLKVRSREHA